MRFLAIPFAMLLSANLVSAATLCGPQLLEKEVLTKLEAILSKTAQKAFAGKLIELNEIKSEIKVISRASDKIVFTYEVRAVSKTGTPFHIVLVSTRGIVLPTRLQLVAKTTQHFDNEGNPSLKTCDVSLSAGKFGEDDWALDISFGRPYAVNSNSNKVISDLYEDAVIPLYLEEHPYQYPSIEHRWYHWLNSSSATSVEIKD